MDVQVGPGMHLAQRQPVRVAPTRLRSRRILRPDGLRRARHGTRFATPGSCPTLHADQPRHRRRHSRPTLAAQSLYLCITGAPPMKAPSALPTSPIVGLFMCASRSASDAQLSTITKRRLVVDALEQVVHLAALVLALHARERRLRSDLEIVGVPGLDGELNGQSNGHRGFLLVDGTGPVARAACHGSRSGGALDGTPSPHVPLPLRATQAALTRRPLRPAPTSPTSARRGMLGPHPARRSRPRVPVTHAKQPRETPTGRASDRHDQVEGQRFRPADSKAWRSS